MSREIRGCLFYLVVRLCDMLSAPKNGKFTGGGTCGREYGTVCSMECNEGYELSGSATRTCEVNSKYAMQWSGSTMLCTGESILCFGFHHNSAVSRFLIG